MINDFNVNFNNYSNQILNFYGFWEYTCPSCQATHSFSRHAFYTRNICHFSFGSIEESTIKILRLICNSCGVTHSILPADIIPYVIFTFSCILELLIQHFVNEKSVLDVSKENKISFQLMYLFINRLVFHFKPCVIFLRVFLAVETDFSSSSKDILSLINNNFRILDFQYQYLNYHKKAFFMKRIQNILSKQIHIGAHFKPPT